MPDPPLLRGAHKRHKRCWLSLWLCQHSYWKWQFRVDLPWFTHWKPLKTIDSMVDLFFLFVFCQRLPTAGYTKGPNCPMITMMMRRRDFSPADLEPWFLHSIDGYYTLESARLENTGKHETTATPFGARTWRWKTRVISLETLNFLHWHPLVPGLVNVYKKLMGKIHKMLWKWENTHYFDWAIFNSFRLGHFQGRKLFVITQAFCTTTEAPTIPKNHPQRDRSPWTTLDPGDGPVADSHQCHWTDLVLSIAVKKTTTTEWCMGWFMFI